MENTNDQLVKKVLYWGVPGVILLILIVLLVVELTSDSNVGKKSDQLTEENVIQATADTEENIQNDGSEMITDTDNSPVTGESVEPQAATDLENDSKVQASPGDENSYIVEEGDSLWKIAQKKNVLGDPWKWKTILIQNRDKINYTIVSEETGQWKVMVDAGKKLVIKEKDTSTAKVSFDRSRKKKFALQLLSMNTDQLEKAVDIVKFLIKDGYYAYLYRTREKIKTSKGISQYFYRIRVGFFETENEALNIGREIINRYWDLTIFSNDYWAVLPSYRELNGELIDFGIQRNKPWIIQLSQTASREDAIHGLSKISSLVDFSYISQKKKPEGGHSYRTRIGFFETSQEAYDTLAKIKNAAKKSFAKARVMELRHVMESAPGQATGETKISQIKTAE